MWREFSRRGLVLAAAGTALACHPPSPTPIHDHATAMPGPASTTPAAGRVALNDGCVACHTVQATEWRASQHRSAHDDPDFIRAAARERQGFCRSCHAPEADPARAPSRSEASLGVACVSCHVPHGTLDGTLAAPGEPTHATPSPHAVIRADAFAGVDACGGCHEFAFPKTPALAMQSTLTEHAASAFAQVPCAECHMPWVGDGPQRHRSHAFAASRDPAMLRTAVDVRAERAPGGRVTLRLTPGRIGHAFPTGDLFRRLWVDAEAIDADGDPIAYDGRALARHFAGPGQPVTHDDRPGAPAQHATGGVVDVTFEFGTEIDAHAIVWRVMHQRVELPLDGDDAKIFGETVVTEGRIEAAGASP